MLLYRTDEGSRRAQAHEEIADVQSCFAIRSKPVTAGSHEWSQFKDLARSPPTG
jgi:hypothetical protein